MGRRKIVCMRCTANARRSTGDKRRVKRTENKRSSNVQQIENFRIPAGVPWRRRRHGEWGRFRTLCHHLDPTCSTSTRYSNQSTSASIFFQMKKWQKRWRNSTFFRSTLTLFRSHKPSIVCNANQLPSVLQFVFFSVAIFVVALNLMINILENCRMMYTEA